MVLVHTQTPTSVCVCVVFEMWRLQSNFVSISKPYILAAARLISLECCYFGTQTDRVKCKAQSSGQVKSHIFRFHLANICVYKRLHICVLFIKLSRE